jgi:uncharacterized protein YjbI with pentapeptide repeats
MVMIRDVIKSVGKNAARSLDMNAFSWSSYWMTRKPSNVVLTVLSDTSMKVDWTDAAQAADGIKVYFNDVLKATIAFGVGTATIEELTANTLYVVKVRAYKGTQESDPITASDYTTGSMTFSSVQPASLNQVAWTYKIDTGKVVKINWGYGADIQLTADGTDKTITSVFPTNNTTYTITVSGAISYLRKFYIYNEATVIVNTSEIKKFKGLNYLYVITGTNTGLTVTTSDLVGLPLTYVNLQGINLSSNVHTSHFAGMSLTNLLIGAIPTLANCVIRSSDLVGMPLKEIKFSANAGTYVFNTSNLIGMPLTDFSISGYGEISLRSADFVGMNLVTWHVFGGFTGCTIDTADFIGMPMVTFEQGHTGANTTVRVRSSDFAGMSSTLATWTLYGDGGIYDIDLSDFALFAQLRYFYMNGSGHPFAVAAGKLSDLPTTLDTIYTMDITGLDITTGTMKAWATTTITLSNAHPSADVDAFLNAWAEPAGTGTKTITITRSRTAASDAAVATLNGKGKTINTSG